MPEAAFPLRYVNEALGMYLYSGPELAPFGEDELVRPCCAVERTLGDRRLGTHVLGAVELLLPLLSGVGADDEAAVRALFPAARPDGLEVSTACLMTDAMLAFELVRTSPLPPILSPLTFFFLLRTNVRAPRLQSLSQPLSLSL